MENLLNALGEGVLKKTGFSVICMSVKIRDFFTDVLPKFVKNK